MTSLDVTCMTEEVRKVALGWRLSNMYDLDDKTYLMKFAIPGEPEKVNVLVESGIRFHRTFYDREKSLTPSNFTMKLRKHLRGKRLEGVDQLGVDRVVDFRFGSGDTVSHLVVELYSNGNIVLTDCNYLVQALLRSHQFDEDVVLKVGEFYPLNYITKTLREVNGSQDGILTMDVASFTEFARRKEQEAIDWHAGPANEKSRRKLKKMYVKQLLMNKESGVSHYSGEIIEHCILTAGLDFSAKVEDLYADQDMVKALLEALVAGSALVAASQSQRRAEDKEEGEGEKDSAPSTPPGFIFSGKDGTFTEFCSLLLRQHEGKAEDQKLTFPSFGEAVDEYFARVETQKMEKSVADAEKAAQVKIGKVREARESHIHSLVSRQEQMEISAKLVEYHAEDIDKVALVLNSCLDNAMDWESIEEMVAQETAAGNPIAGLVCGFNLAESKVSLRLRNVLFFDSESDEEKEEEENDDSDLDIKGAKGKRDAEKNDGAEKYVEVEVDLTMSAYANAREMFGDKKSAVIKEKKAIDASYSAMAGVERAMEKKLEFQKNQKALHAVRHIHWFEKFNWFITSEGYLVISGRDAAQTEQIALRYMRPQDIFIHSDCKGAFPCVLRHKPVVGVEGGGDSPAPGSVKISPFAIHEAAHACVNRSSAWASKIMTSAWWVWGGEVVAPEAGDYCRMGTFRLRGHKNLLPPQGMEMGFGILFRVDDESAQRHASERKDRADTLGVEMESTVSEAASRYGLEELEEAVLPPAPPPPKEERDGEGEGEEQKQEQEQEPVFESLADSEEEEEEEPPSDPVPAPNAGKGGNNKALTPVPGPTPAKKGGKKLNKKKARRYAEQDEEDRELAMHALGHGKPGNKLKDKVEVRRKEEEEREQARKARKAGTAQFVQEQEKAILSAVPESTRNALDSLVVAGLIKEGEVAKEELKVLSAFSSEEAREVLALFEEALRSHRGKATGNTSGYLSGIMRRYSKDKGKGKEREKAAAAEHQYKDGNAADSEEMLAFLAEQADGEGADGAEGDGDDVGMFTSCPRPDDTILYALPFCGPYTSMREFKYKAKLLPGPLKKSKGVKTCMEFFTRLPQCKGRERAVIDAMRDGETTALMMAEVKISMPGLQAIKQTVKQQNKKKQRGEKQKHGR